MSSNQFGKKPNLSLKQEEQVLSFFEVNRRAFAQLVAFAQTAEGFTLGFIESNFDRDTHSIIDALQKNPACQDIQWEILTFKDPKLRFFRDALVDAVSQVTIRENAKLIVIVRGLEYSIGLSGDYPPMLQDLNFVRDDLLKSFPNPLLLCLPDYAITRLARFAPDLWAWKSGLFHFQSSPATQLEITTQVLEDERIREGLDIKEKQERIDLLQRLLMEAKPSGHTPTPSDRRRCANILRELGILYRSIGEVASAKKSFADGLALMTEDVKLASMKASLLYELGYLYSDLRQVDKAITLYQQSLELNDRIGNVQGKAATLHCMAMIYADLRQVDKAITLYQQSLELNDRIGNVQGKAATLHCMAMIYADQGQVEEAIALYKQSLELKERIGDVQGKAATLRQMAGIYANQGQVEEAIALYQQSLELNDRIGNVQGKAATLHCMAMIYADQGQVEEVIALYKQSLELNDRIGNVQGKAATLHCMAMIYADQGQVEEAIALYKQSLELDDRIGDVQGKAATLVMLGQLIANVSEDYNTAISYLQESLEIFQRLKSPSAEIVQSILSGICDRANTLSST